MSDKKLEDVTTDEQELDIDEVSAEELEDQAGGMHQVAPCGTYNGDCGVYGS
ncbi:hypothetical protein [Pseudoalteromonas sp. OOF1S-7]|uniref:hypothetical protein n=1 Tax=Pseudoalteromonas sp. OOF1S-7 TaxID=2917757 RepID=UPI001EF50EED|nr:hypothetical protein [Pseudoalteromonas sp. OOF1S-7]MCG7536144.1 hypothetical protein [Pseudoalteromonas sp. OOF1S-7]